MKGINEKELNDYPKPIFIEGVETILNQMKNNIGKICLEDGTTGTGFFCKIPFPDFEHLLNVFITNNHIINEKYLNEENKIFIKINNDKYTKTINLKNKIKYTNKEYDITVIEIKNEDEINDFLELDENILNDPGLGYIGNSIYLIHYPSYPNGTKVAVSYGVLKRSFEDKKYNFKHYCCSQYGSSGSPILNTSNYKVIGLHKQAGNNQQNYNIGVFLYNFINEFNNCFNNKEKSNIIENKSIANVKEKSNIIENKNNINFKEKLNIIENKKIENVKEKSNNNIIINNYENIITIQYRNDYGKIKLFGETFIKNNKDKCKIIFNNKEFELLSYLNIKDNIDIIEIKLKIIKIITNMDHMFWGCTQLISIPDAYKLDTSHVTTMEEMFCGCISLSYLQNIDKWNLQQLKYWGYIFFCCSSLKSISTCLKAFEKYNEFVYYRCHLENYNKSFEEKEISNSSDNLTDKTLFKTLEQLKSIFKFN